MARNIIHLKPKWLSETLDLTTSIQPEEMMAELTAIITSDKEPTIIRLRAIELLMRAHGMFSTKQNDDRTVTLAIDLSGSV